MAARKKDSGTVNDYIELTPRQVINIGNPDYFPPDNCECYRRFHYDQHKGAFLGFLAVAFILVTFAALLAGLTLAISSLDMTWLHVMSTTGPKRRRHQAKVVSIIKRKASWFLCSMVLVSVICMETLPIIVQSLFGTGWIPVVISTVAIALFSELLPQYLIPRQALQWSYYCWPFIWACMWITAIISWPLSFVLDKLTLPREQGSMYTTEQLGVLIKFHERQEKHGGSLGPDAGRVARGALDLDGRTLEKLLYDSKSIIDNTGDLEKAHYNTSDIVVPWSAVKFVRIDDLVNEQFVLKIKQFSYSRIPVVGNEDSLADAPADKRTAWTDQRIFGFLHIKTLLGFDFQHKGKEIRVRDMPLYPLPIVRDDLPLYDLLNMFQLGISRMAVVILAPARDWTDNQATAFLDKKHTARVKVPLWSSTSGVNTRGSLDLRELGGRVDWMPEFLNAMRDESSETNTCMVTGISCPASLGIVTFEDILDTLLQKTSRDEKDFFDRKTFEPPTKKRKEGDDNTVRSSRNVLRSRIAIPTHARNVYEVFGLNTKNQGTLRRRNLSKHVDGIDGTRDINVFGLDGNDDQSVSHRGALTIDHSSYTENSDGGFHGPSSSADTELSTLVQRNISVNHILRARKGRPVTTSRIVSSPENVTASVLQLGLDFTPRSSSYGLSHYVGDIHDAPSCFEGASTLDEPLVHSESTSDIKKHTLETIVGGCDEPTITSPCYDSQPDIAVSGQKCDVATHLVSENTVVGNKVHTLPFAKYKSQLTIAKIMGQEMRLREESFHDDRSLLPSQWKHSNSDSNGKPGRRTSF